MFKMNINYHNINNDSNNIITGIYYNEYNNN